MFNFKDIYINDWYSVLGPLETKLKNYDEKLKDYYFGEKTIENAEIKMQKNVIDHLGNSDMVIGSDLLDQMTVTAENMINRNMPFFGVYSACASSVGGLITLALMINKKIKNGIYITSSHNLTAEKQFRFPIEYGAPKPKRSTFTITGSIGVKISKNESNIKLLNGTIGRVVDSYIKDAYNIGAVMAPSAVDTLIRHLALTKTNVSDYDLIVTGDLGLVGANIFKELLKEKGISLNNYIDAGTQIYSNNEYSGASGPPVLPLYVFNNVIYNKKYKKILLLATGSLHSPLLTNQKKSIPAITHAITIEVIK